MGSKAGVNGQCACGVPSPAYRSAAALPAPSGELWVLAAWRSLVSSVEHACPGIDGPIPECYSGDRRPREGTNEGSG